MEIRAQGRLAPQRWFYSFLSILAAIIVAGGFWNTYWKGAFDGSIQKSWVVDLHAAVFVGWIVLFITQASLIYRGRTDVHRKVGKFGILYGFVIIGTGLFVSLHQLAVGVAAGNATEAQGFLLIPLFDMIVFPAFFGAAIYYRRKPEFHRRLMLVATTELLTAPVARFNLDNYIAAHWSVFVIWLSPIYLAMIYDYLTKRIIHPVYVIGIVVLASTMIRVFLTQTESWQAIARVIAGWVT
jgi:hypothetical protein